MGRARGAALVAYLFVAGLAAAVYLPGLPGEFVYDDHRLIEKNEGLRRPFDPARAFLRDYYASDVDRMGLGYYRPIAILSNELDFRRGGGSPLAFHVTGLLIHAACSVLVVVLAGRLFGSLGWGATLAGVLFALHPAHAESVAFISGRVDPLAALFVLLALLAHLRANRSTATVPWRAAAGAAWLAALLSKEMAITAPLLIAALETAEEGWPARRDLARRARRYLPYALVLVPYLVLRHTALGAFLAAPTGKVAGSLARPFVTIGSYLAWLVLPPPGLHLEPAPPVGAPMVLAAALALGAAAAVVVLWRRGNRRAAALVAACIVTLLPVAQLRPIETELSERFLYLPSVPACLLLVLPLGAARSRAARVAAVTALLGLAALYTWILLPRVGLWRDEARLWQAQIEESPRSLRALLNLGGVLARRGDVAGARTAYEKARSIDPSLAGAIEGEMESLAPGGQDQVLRLRRSLETSPQDAALWSNLGFLLLERGEPKEARDAFARSIALVPERSLAWLGRALASLDLGDVDEAARAAERVEALNPGLPLARVVRAECELRRGHACEALALAGAGRLEDPSEEQLRRSVVERARRVCPDGP